jgi:NTP pyrophosphatase (non-canonical NTP hydrolase)
MSELIKELCKYDRTFGTDKHDQTIKAIKEEIADVLNMVEQLEYLFGEEDIESIRDKKIARSRDLYL